MQFLDKYLPKGEELKDMQEYERDIIKLGEALTGLSERGITLEQLEKLANGEAWITSFKKINQVKHHKNMLVTDYLGIHEACYDRHNRMCYKVFSGINSNSKTSSFYEYDLMCRFGYTPKPTHVMTFNGKTDVPTPKEDK